MVYPPDVEQKLGFDQLRLRLGSYCLSGLGLRELEQTKFSSDFTEIRTRLHQAAEFKLILERTEPFPENNFFDPVTLFKMASLEGSFIEAEDFLKISLSLQIIFECKTFLTKAFKTYPELFKLSAPILLSKNVPQRIVSKIDENGGIKDNASPELARLRKQLKEEQNKVRKLTEHIYRQAVTEGWVPEGTSPAIRDGRVVIPVSAENKRKLKGFIVDESSTGQTVYMEPAEVLEANNEIRDLGHAARREEVKVLKELTAMLRENMPELEIAYTFLGQLEFNRAKAKLAADLDAGLPLVSQEPGLHWVLAKHPLLYLTRGKQQVVPLTIDLTSQDRMLLISGPNAGGKSVCLKTVGLIQYMLQCGLLVPLQETSVAGIFENIFLDIGDQQSIENDLSTYSSHVRNMTYFINHATRATLVLMDELGSGTDPNLGGGIAQAVLDTLVKSKVWGIVTTHYYNLKVYASHQEGIRNGAMLFDPRKLEPLFQLEIGKPGSSFALEIARKTGLPQATLEAAETIIGKDLTGLELLMKTVAEEKQTVQKRERELTQKEQALAMAEGKYQKVSSEWEARKKEIIDKAKSEASHLLKETNREIEKTIRHIRENKAEKKETRKVRQNLRDLTEKVQTEIPFQPVFTPGEIKIGDSARIVGQEVSGVVLSIKGELAFVQFGDLRSQVRTSQLVRSDQAESNPILSKGRTSGFDIYKKQSEFKDTLDVRGKRVEEAIPLLEQFLDDAVLLGQGELRVLHGKGEGVLRKVIRERLKVTRAVASFADAHIERGGDGITVVVLK